MRKNYEMPQMDVMTFGVADAITNDVSGMPSIGEDVEVLD